MTQRTGIVVIGRNEGERLRCCLNSVLATTRPLVYVDSGSTDGSTALASMLGAAVHALDMRLPFTAARARNEGVLHLRNLSASIEFVQFVDGDCEVVAGWISEATAFLDRHPEVAAVCGRLRERHPERSVYNLLCDLEWNTPVGEAKASGGIVMIRMTAWDQVNGFRDDLIAGEEPELGVRLRAKGWRIWRLDSEMAWHDAAMMRWTQWWQRCKRAGFAYAEGVRLHGAPPERHWVKEWRSAWVWGAVLPLGIAVGAVAFRAEVMWTLLLYLVQMLRIGARLPIHSSRRWTRAFFLLAGKFPEAAGQLKALTARALKRRTTVIEYK
ncbi:MAG: glycosyltransferase family 2 protein [Ramlibacter sp.]|nr:glycosyltransferase family 2 protein [Ramlibacter sp.]